MIDTRVMTGRCLLAAGLAAICLVGCAARRPNPPPAVHEVVLLIAAEPRDRSAVTGVFTFYSWIAEMRAAAPSFLSAAVATELRARGIAIVGSDALEAPGQGNPPRTLHQARALVQHAAPRAPVLFLALERCEASNHDFPQFVVVGARAVLLDPRTGATRWERRVDGPIATRGSTDLASAYRAALRQAAMELVGDWTEEPSIRRE